MEKNFSLHHNYRLNGVYQYRMYVDKTPKTPVTELDDENIDCTEAIQLLKQFRLPK